MDPISQGTIGGLVPQAILDRKHLGWFTLCGVCAGLAPDLDIFIRSENDPLLFLTFHRQFTHSLIFIPVGALVVALLLWIPLRSRLNLRQIYIACLLGYATHGLLDACTTYGTQLLWPFTDLRISWNNIAVVDPVFTLPALVLVITGVLNKKRWPSLVALSWIFFYLAIGQIQHHRAEQFLEQIAHLQGHEPNQLSAKPSFANILIWKGIYEYEGTFYVNALRVGVSSENQTCGSTSSTQKLNLQKHLPWLQESQQLTDVHRFNWFSQDYVGLHNNDSDRLVDVRYSLVPDEIGDFWSIRVDPNKAKDEHVQFISSERANVDQRDRFWGMLLGEGCTPLESNVESNHVTKAGFFSNSSLST